MRDMQKKKIQQEVAYMRKCLRNIAPLKTPYQRTLYQCVSNSLAGYNKYWPLN